MMQLLGKKGQLIWLTFLISQIKVTDFLPASVSSRSQESNKITISIHRVSIFYRQLLQATTLSLSIRNHVQDVCMCAQMHMSVCVHPCKGPTYLCLPSSGMQACPPYPALFMRVPELMPSICQWSYLGSPEILPPDGFKKPPCNGKKANQKFPEEVLTA